MNYGFVTGLPRSGSAWLANYLSYGNCMFLHDAWKDYTLDSLKDKAEGCYAAGTCDPANVLALDKLDKHFPEAKWVVITRPSAEVKQACETIKFPFADFTADLKRLMDSRKVLKVPFKQLFKRADEIGRFIYPDWQSPDWRLKQLTQLNVQLHWGNVSEQFTVPENLSEMPVMTPAKMEFLRLMKEIVGDDPHAMSFVVQALEASDLYKNLDQHKPVDFTKAKDTLEAMATQWLINPFVKQFSASLAPAIMSGLESYLHGPAGASCPLDLSLINTVTYIFKGNDGVKEFMPKVRELSNQILQEKH